MFSVLVVSWLAGFASFVGGIIGVFEGSAETEAKREVIYGIQAFGGGILVAAVAFALAPEGIGILSPAGLVATFCSGGFLFAALDAYLSRRGGTKAQFLAMLMDFVPEALSLGAVFETDRRLGMLLAAFIGAQNLPEGFNSYREIVAAGARPKVTLAVLLGTSLLGPIASATGYLFLHNREVLTAAIMSFAGGGILYLIFQDIAPQAKMERHWSPPLGAVFGFVVGMLGKQLIG